jgi:uncharacterized membrane protein YdjX (TVP38/TMEM64 family)
MSDATETSRSGLARRLPLIVIAIVAVVGGIALRDHISFQTLADNRDRLIELRDARYGLSVLAFMAAYAALVAFSLPGALLATLSGGFLFGLFPGALINVTAATVGASLIFLAARRGFGDRLTARIDASEGRIARLREGLRENEISVLLLLRLVPAIPFFAANLLAALAGVSLGRFVYTTFFGIIPGSVVYTWVGAGLGEVFASGEAPDLGIIFRPHVLGPILGLCLLAALPIVLRLRDRGAR